MICLEIFSVRVKEISNLCMLLKLPHWLHQVNCKTQHNANQSIPNCQHMQYFHNFSPDKCVRLWQTVQ